MNGKQFKKLLKMRINDSLEEYMERMEAMFGEDYWEQDFNMGAAVRGFATDLGERYHQEEVSIPQDKEEEPAEEELDDGEHKGDVWRIAYHLADDPTEEHFVDLVRAPTEKHAKVLFNRRHSDEGCVVTDIRKGE